MPSIFAAILLPATAVAALLTIGLLCAGWPWSLLALWPAASTWIGVRLVRMTWGWGK